MSGFEVYDMGGIPAAVMKLKFVNTEESGWFFRLDKLSATTGRINTLKTFFVDLLDRVFVKPCDICDILVGVSSMSEQITNLL